MYVCVLATLSRTSRRHHTHTRAKLGLDFVNEGLTLFDEWLQQHHTLQTVVEREEKKQNKKVNSTWVYVVFRTTNHSPNGQSSNTIPLYGSTTSVVPETSITSHWLSRWRWCSLPLPPTEINHQTSLFAFLFLSFFYFAHRIKFLRMNHFSFGGKVYCIFPSSCKVSNVVECISCHLWALSRGTFTPLPFYLYVH